MEKSDAMKTSNIRGVVRLLPRHLGQDLCFALLCCLTAALTILEPIVLAQLIDSAASQLGGVQYRLAAAAIVVFEGYIGCN
ncbi:MAG: hypothetical protein LUJ09_06820 [Firmicutes bacterium]|nr:hypothetical protein [Bacillota bacterium]